jgi:hypothetical protein
MHKAPDNCEVVAAFIARKIGIDTIRARLTALGSNRLGRNPDAVVLGDVGTLASYLSGLREISDAAFQAGEDVA